MSVQHNTTETQTSQSVSKQTSTNTNKPQASKQSTTTQAPTQSTKPVSSTPVTSNQNTNVTNTPKTQSTTQQTQSQGGGTATYTGTIDYWRADLHSGPSSSSSVIEYHLGKGAEVTVLSSSNGWDYVMVNSNGDTGYVYSGFVD